MLGKNKKQSPNGGEFNGDEWYPWDRKPKKITQKQIQETDRVLSSVSPFPIGSMHGIFTYIYHKKSTKCR